MPPTKQQSQGIVTPHEHDVLSGRGNFVNYHAGNEHFRALVRKHKLDYVKCPKPQKGKFSRMIVDEIKNRTPPGRFLKQDGSTKLWYDIGEKKALDKTRQALREGAPEIMKEMSGDSGDDTDGEDAFRRMSSAGGVPGGFPGDSMNHPFLGNNASLQSPTLTNRNMLNMTSPQLLQSPQLMSPGLLLSVQLSPDMQPLSASQQIHAANRMGQLIDSQVIPAPQVHRQSDPSNMNQTNINQSNTQHQMMMAGMGNEFMDNQASPIGMMSQMSSMNNQIGLSEEQMLQNKLAAIYANNQFEPRPIVSSSKASSSVEQFQQNQKLQIPQGQNPRRMPPPSLLKRDDSLRMDKVFNSPGAGSTKKKYEGNSSSHLSAMSLSIGDMNDEGNLSSVFDSSLRISVSSEKDPLASRRSRQERSSNATEHLDMSVATLGVSETGNMSFATFGDPKLQESEGNMSFSRVFEDPDKDLG